MAVAHVNRIGTAVPDHDVHEAFIGFVEEFLPGRREKLLFRRMASRADIEHRYSFIEPRPFQDGSADAFRFYERGAFPSTAKRMEWFEPRALELARRAVTALDIEREREAITHLIVASCTGFSAPGLDQQLLHAFRLNPSVERTLVGFMGCAAAVNALKLAHHIVRSEPHAKVLLVNLELCTLHLRETPDIEALLGCLLFGDGCAATLISAEETGIALQDFHAVLIPDTAGLITWHIGDSGFAMNLSGDVPGQIARALRNEAARNDEGGVLRGARTAEVDLWAVHAGGRTILDAVEQGLALDGEALRWSRGVLRDFGNISSATLMFVLERILRGVEAGLQGVGMAFGPGLAAETFRFRTVGA